MSRYDADDVYCIPGTAVLKNKAGIKNQDLLDNYEADFTAIRILELSQTPVEGNFNLAHLCKIHEYLFQDVYEWAGEIRSVDIIRGDSRFCNVRQIQSYSNTVFSALAAEKYLNNLESTALARLFTEPQCPRAAHRFATFHVLAFRRPIVQLRSVFAVRRQTPPFET